MNLKSENQLRRPRFVIRQMCNLDDPDDLSSWVVLDTRTGVPRPNQSGTLAYTKGQAQAEMKRLSEMPYATVNDAGLLPGRVAAD